MVLNSKTLGLLQTRKLTLKQLANTRLNLKETAEHRTELRSYPRRFIFELTNACNLQCIMCGRKNSDFRPHFLTLADLQRFEPLFHYIEEITLFGWGEPTIHPQFTEILQYLRDFPIRKYFVTNGTRLSKLKQAIFDNQVDLIAVSLDGASAEINNRIRVGSDFNQVIANIAEIVREKKRLNVKYPYINLVFTVMRSNLEELPQLIRLAHQLELPEVKVVYLTVFDKRLRAESLWNHSSQVRAVFEAATVEANSFQVKLKLPPIQGEDPSLTQPHKPCFVAWRDFFLGADRFVRPCQSTPIKFFSIDQHPTFMEMWNSPEYQEFRARVNQDNEMSPACLRCYQSSHANWNLYGSFFQIDVDFSPKWK